MPPSHSYQGRKKFILLTLKGLTGSKVSFPSSATQSPSSPRDVYQLVVSKAWEVSATWRPLTTPSCQSDFTGQHEKRLWPRALCPRPSQPARAECDRGMGGRSSPANGGTEEQERGTRLHVNRTWWAFNPRRDTPQLGTQDYRNPLGPGPHPGPNAGLTHGTETTGAHRRGAVWGLASGCPAATDTLA